MTRQAAVMSSRLKKTGLKPNQLPRKREDLEVLYRERCL
jgi:hypothetical protein